MPPEYVADPPVAGVSQVEPLEQLGGAGARAPASARRAQPAHHPRFSPPVCSSSSAAYWPVRLMRRRTSRRSATTS